MKTDYQILAWNDELLTGIAQIDEQHHMLVNMLNEANQRLSVESRPDQLAHLVHNLMSYALYHFETEEVLMLKNHCPSQHQALHIQEHRMFSTKVADMQKALSQGRSVSPGEVLSFLSEWLRNHIQNTDKQLGEFLTATSQLTS